jgi:hypothetical protein
MCLTREDALLEQHGHPLMMGAMALILFPKLALACRGSRPSVAVMPFVRGDDTDSDEAPVGRIRTTRKLSSDSGAHHERPARIHVG